MCRAGHVGGVVSGVAEDANRSVGDEDVWEDYGVSVVVFLVVAGLFFFVFVSLKACRLHVFIVISFNLMEKYIIFVMNIFAVSMPRQRRDRMTMMTTTSRSR